MAALTFHSPQRYQASAEGYRFLPFKFMRWGNGDVFLSNLVGEFVFLTATDFQAFVDGRLFRSSEAYITLKSRHFLTDGASRLPIELLATKYRTKSAFLDGFTRLHLFVITLRCDHTCSYCQVSRVTEDRTQFDMSMETAGRAIDLMFRSPSPALKVEFQGGEPLLNFDLLRWIVEQVTTRNRAESRQIEFVVTSNLSQLTDEMLEFFAAHKVVLSTSLDGPDWLHNRNRPRQGQNTFDQTRHNIVRARAALGADRVAALMTTTETSLQHPVEIIDEYVSLGFDSVFLRPISPYGFATKSKTSKYDMDAFLTFYRTGLSYIIELNRQGTRMMEIYAQIVLQKLLTPFATGYVDLQSPAGAGIAVAVYNYDGGVYASDEGRMLAEMGDQSFRLGTVNDEFEALFGSGMLHSLVAGSCVDTLPGCTDCAFTPYCGADPVFHWATQADPIGHRPTSGFCSKNMGIIRHLLELLRNGDDFTRELLTTWATMTNAVVPPAA